MIQAGKDYGVEVVVAYEQKRVGQVIYPPGTLRQVLVQRGLVKPLGPPADLLGDTAGDSASEESVAGRRRSARNSK